jgi:hypothetical protein
MIYKIKEIKNKLVEESYSEAMKEFNEFFGIGWEYNLPHICVLDNRKQIDNLCYGAKGKRWMVGFSDGSKIAYVLDNKKIAEESNHKEFTSYEYKALIKHEICHLFYTILSNNNNKPIWLCEGVSLYLSGQNNLKPKIKEFSNFYESYEKDLGKVYQESGFAVGLLVKKFGKKKLLKLIKESGKAKSKRDFSVLFKTIYSFDLSVKNFNKLLTK